MTGLVGGLARSEAPLPFATMAAKPATEITLSKLRDGAPDALAALCARRGAAIYAYCRRVVGDEGAAGAAAAAFAQFRLAVIAPGTLSDGRQAEPLLRRVTRRAALSDLYESMTTVDGGPVSDECHGRSLGLLAYVGGTLSATERDAVGAHIDHCAWCAATRQRLEAGEPTFSESNPPLPPSVAELMLTAMVRVAPVNVGDADTSTVRDEAMHLFTGQREVATSPPPTAAPASPAEAPWPDDDFAEAWAPSAATTTANAADEPIEPAQPPPGDIPADARQSPALPRASFASNAPGAGSRPGRLRARLSRRIGYGGVSRTRIVLGGLLRLVLVAAVAGGAGIVIGMGLSELSGDKAATVAPVTPSTTTTPATTTVASVQRPVEILGSTVHAPAGGGAERAIVRVRVRVENASGQPFTTPPPQLLVDGARFRAAPPSAGTSGALLANRFDTGASVDGTLRFDVPSVTPEEVTSARVRLRIVDKMVVLAPEPG